MPDDLYERDALAWSEHQVALLRRISEGGKPNEEPDWPNLIEEIEAMGRNELRACTSQLVNAMEHLLKIRGFPHGPVLHWTREIEGFLREASDEFTPSMAARIDLGRLYSRAIERARRFPIDGRAAGPLPEECPFVLPDLLANDLGGLPDPDALLGKLRLQASSTIS